jgi:ribosomal-protein-alanine N-acetyltransferase
MSEAGVQIGPAAPSDADALADVHACVFDAAWDQSAFARLLQRPGAVAFIARSESPPRAIGFILGQLAADEAEILSLGVVEERRRLGIATGLVATIAASARRAGARKLFLEVAADNSAAVQLYVRLGFAEIGRRAAYYQSPARPARDALLLCLTL